MLRTRVENGTTSIFVITFRLAGSDVFLRFRRAQRDDAHHERLAAALGVLRGHVGRVHRVGTQASHREHGPRRRLIRRRRRRRRRRDGAAARCRRSVPGGRWRRGIDGEDLEHELLLDAAAESLGARDLQRLGRLVAHAAIGHRVRLVCT